eukprot:CAMPEP_0114538688 /NCGR_PEP_ID=MMETSP0109-20121206/30281_1 /TAXON_ID=29199 /ORGANISM="Chlorarachnion reptans, Strain CCCM449" /LENGTH=448 /DNA_ID=CAMNT_0001722733 /DNA_START=27 /DNA_END=1373 /DNA_ORIENTATION=+
MAAVALLLLPLLLAPRGSDAAYCHGKPDPNAKPNKNAIVTQKPAFVKSTGNASLYRAGDGEDAFSVVHLYGATAYEVGYNHGVLMRDDMRAFFPKVFAYFESQFVQAINSTVPWIPKEIALWVAEVFVLSFILSLGGSTEIGLDVALDATWDLMILYSPRHFAEEMRGMSDATGVEYKMIRRIHMIGELTQGHCSMLGAWGTAVEDKRSLLQLRALDWDTDGPFQDFPQVTIYHAADGRKSKTFANVGWTGWIGSISGMSAEALAVSEIGVTFPDGTFGKQSRVGYPFVFLLRDILQFDASLPDARARITNARRTCNLILGVGDGKMAYPVDDADHPAPFNSVQYSHSVANFINDTHFLPVNDTWHSKIKNMVYHGMDWLCPGYSVVLQRQLQDLDGTLTPEIIASRGSPRGDLRPYHNDASSCQRSRIRRVWATDGVRSSIHKTEHD